MKKVIVAFLVIGVNALTINFSEGCMPSNGSSQGGIPDFPAYPNNGISVSSSPRSPILTQHGVIFPKSPLGKRKLRRYSDVLADLESTLLEEQGPVPLGMSLSESQRNIVPILKSDSERKLSSLLEEQGPAPLEGSLSEPQQKIIPSLFESDDESFSSPYWSHRPLYSPTSSQESSSSSSDSEATQPCDPEPQQKYKKPAAPSKKRSRPSTKAGRQPKDPSDSKRSLTPTVKQRKPRTTIHHSASGKRNRS